MISIIIPTLNEENIIGETLNRFRAGLKKTDFEIIVSDGGSSDKTVAIAKKYADRIVKEKDKTIASGRNLGAKSAKGEYLVFFDADVTVPAPDVFFRRALNLFRADKDLVALTGSIRVLPDKETLGDKIVFGLLNLFHRISNNAFGVGRAAGEFQMIKTAVFKKLGGYREDLAASEDYEMFGRLSKNGKTFMAKELLIMHTGRRAHKIGWPKLLWQWFTNAMSVMLFKKKAVSKNWEVIR